MSGVKGRSGRRPLSVEAKRLKTIDKAWELTDSFLKDDTQTLEKRIEQAIKLVLKDVPEKLQHSGSIEGTKINIAMVKVTDDRSGLQDNATPSGRVQVSNGQ